MGTAAAVAIPALAVVAIAALAAIKSGSGPALNGGLTLEAAPGVRLYVGERLVGTGSRFLAWDDLVGRDGHEPLATTLEPEESFDVFQVFPKRHGAVTAEGLGGRGAVFVHGSRPFAAKFVNDFQMMGEQVLLRRADGTLDRILVLIGECRTADGRRQPFLAPIRARHDGGYLVANPGDDSGSPRSYYIAPVVVRTTLRLSCSFVAGSPPEELAGEVKTKGLWEPADR